MAEHCWTPRATCGTATWKATNTTSRAPGIFRAFTSMPEQTEGMHVLAALRGQINSEQVVTDELQQWNKLLPTRWSDVALRGHETEVADWFGTVLRRRDIELLPEEVVLARKLGRGARPIAINGLAERLLYRAAVSGTGLPADDRSPEAYRAFQNAPRDAVGCKYVLIADIAAYYQYIDHERLIDEVVTQTGNDLWVGMAAEVLEATSGRRYGIPQLSDVSDVLGNAYLRPIDRSLARAGLTAWRFADDFRVACDSYAEALTAWERIDDAARALGLVLNESKTLTPKIKLYMSNLEARQNKEAELFAQLDGDSSWATFDFSEYDDREETSDPIPTSLLPDEEDDDEEQEHGAGDDVDPEGDVTREQVAAAEQVFDLWYDEDEDDETQRTQRAAMTAGLLRRAIKVLTIGRVPARLNAMASVLVYEPSLTPSAARYLRACAEDHRRAVRQTLDEICEDEIVSPWQQLWIAHIAGELDPRKSRGNEPTHVDWLRDQARSDHCWLRAEAALALARRRLLTGAEAVDVFEHLPALHQPTGLIAIAATGDEDAARSAIAGPLDELRVAWALQRFAQ